MPIIGSVAFMFGCDRFTSYEVDNRTDQALVSWLAFSECGNAFDEDTKIHERSPVPARTVVELGRSFSSHAEEPGCTIIATEAGRAVLLEEYDYGRKYILDEPIQPGREFPEQGDDYHVGWPRSRVIELGLALVMAGGILYGIYLGIRSTIRYRKRNDTSSPPA